MRERNTLQDVIQGFSAFQDRTALTFFQKQDILQRSYAQLEKETAELAAGLKDQGLEKGGRAAVIAPNGWEWIVTALGIIRAGGILVPVDVQSDIQTVEHILSDSGARLVFTTSDQQSRLNELENTDLHFLLFDEGASDQEELSWRTLLKKGRQDPFSSSPEDNAVLFYTSGTTGKPKGVPLTHRMLLFQINALDQQKLLREEDRVLLPLPLHHVYPLVVGLFTPLTAGLQVVFPQALTGPQIMRALSEGETTVMVGVPRLYRALLEGVTSRISSGGLAVKIFFASAFALSKAAARMRFFPGKFLLAPFHRRIAPRLRLLASGGSALSPEAQRDLCAFGWQVGIGYGLTETAPLLTVQHPSDYCPGSAGRAVEEVELRINKNDPDRLNEVLARGPNVFKGYWHLEEETREAFTGEGWFRTGDMGYFKNSRLFLTGRVSTLIVTESGKNIQPDEIEEALTEVELVKEAGVLQKDNRLVAVIVPDKEALSAQESQALDQVWRMVNKRSQDLPTYKRLDDFLISSGSLPRTRLGKIRRHLLPEIYDRAKSGEEGREQEDAHPVSVQELAGDDQNLLEDPDARRVWDWLAAKYSDRRLTPDTSPQLELGIDSMSWINLTLEIRQQTGKELSEEAIARIKTVRDLLREVAEHAQAAEESQDWFKDPETKISQRQRKWLKEQTRFQKVLAWGLKGFNRILARVFFRVRAQGLENLPDNRPYIIAANHLSFLDPFMIGAVLPDEQIKHLSWTGWTGVAFHNVLSRTFSRLARVVPVDPQKGALSSLAFVLTLLQREENVVIFPEGQRSHSGELIEFKPGLGLVLDHIDVPVVPVIISGTYEAWPVRQRLPRPHPVAVHFFEPVGFEQLKDRAGGSDQPEDLMRALFEIMKDCQQKANT
ncbi:MAG: AMP-binding protein [Candidatus Omnitrophota bacterium]